MRRAFECVCVLVAMVLSGCGADAPSGGGQGSPPANNEPANNEPANNTPTDVGMDGGPMSQDGGPVVVSDAGVVVEDDAESFVCFPTRCAGKLLECGDCEDNDGDGATDWRDPECLGPCDNTEGPGLGAGVGGVNRANCKVDCYFDFGNGAGNDDCKWDHRCDRLEPESPNCTFDEERLGSRDCPLEQSEQCGNFCRPFTPNGCDCFGCCTFPQLKEAGPEGARASVWIGNLDEDNASTCALDSLLDEEKCPRCTPVEDCFNDCGECEICVGKPEVPEDCFEEPGGEDVGPGEPDAGRPDAGDDPPDNPAQCSEGEQPCGLPGQDDCERNYYCITGCCIFVE